MMKYFAALFFGLILLPESPALPVSAPSKQPPKPELIIDTDVAEGKNPSESPKDKEPDPALAKQSINIGNYYLKQKNYAAAIERYLEAIEYQPNSGRAYEGLARAYEKNGEIKKAIQAYQTFLEKNPASSSSADFRLKLSKLEKKSN
jgi:tetratricopeptide (TPR) repeat protein